MTPWAPQSCASNHQPTIWVWEGYNFGANRTCNCGFYLFRITETGMVFWMMPRFHPGENHERQSNA